MNTQHDSITAAAEANRALQAAAQSFTGFSEQDYPKPVKRQLSNGIQPMQPTTEGRRLRSVLCKLDSTLELAPGETVIDGLLTKSQSTLTLLIDTQGGGVNGPQLVTFHTANINPQIPNNATHLISLYDPADKFSRVQCYIRSKPANSGAESDAPSADTLL